MNKQSTLISSAQIFIHKDTLCHCIINAHSRHCHPSSCSEAAVDENRKIQYIAHCMFHMQHILHTIYSAYYTVPCILYLLYMYSGICWISAGCKV